MANLELLIDTTRPLTSVVPQDDCEKEENDDPSSKLQAYAPMYTLIDPPYELAPCLPVVVALQSELFTSLMDTRTPLAVVNPDVLTTLLMTPPVPLL